MVAFHGDNCNTNIGGVHRRGQNNDYSRLKRELATNIAGIGFGAYTVDNALQTAVDGLQIEIEVLVVKIYKYFHIYTVGVNRASVKRTPRKYECGIQKTYTALKYKISFSLACRLNTFEGLKLYFAAQEMSTLIRYPCESDSGELHFLVCVWTTEQF